MPDNCCAARARAMSLDVARMARRLAKERTCWAAGGSGAAEPGALPHGCAQLIEEADPEGGASPGARLLTLSPGWERDRNFLISASWWPVIVQNLRAVDTELFNVPTRY